MFDALKNLDPRLQTIIGAVLLFSIYWAYQFFGTATVEITSDPAGAVVTVDGRQRGLTPIDRLEVAAGDHGIRVEHTHFAPSQVRLTLRRGDHAKRHIALQLGKGTLQLLSNPRGAWVEVDGERLANATPTQLETTSGLHEIRMGQAERYVISEKHTLKDGENLEVNFNLNIDPHGTLTIVTVPRGTNITFLDADLSYTPKLRVRTGEYAIRVEKAGYIAQEFRYKVRYGDNLHQLQLQRGYGPLRVRAKPADAELTVIYDLSGKTQRKSYSANMSVPVGRVEVRARALGHRTEHKKLNMALQGAKVSFDLKTIHVESGSEIIDSLRIGGQAPVMVVVPAGKFRMGDDGGSYSEQPARTVVLTQPFAVSKTEVRIGDYMRFAQATRRGVNPKLVTTDADVAMAYVSVADANAYADWLSTQTGKKYRLPSEAEWEYAARAGSTTDYFFGDDPLQLCQYGNVADLATQKNYRDWTVLGCDDGQVRVGRVGKYAANPFGLLDIYGNVSEWVSDCGLPNYANAPSDGRAADEGLGCESHGYRGASWDSLAAEARSAYRNSGINAIDDRGIRLIREL